MAIYHLRAKVIARAAGRSSVAASAYRSATRLQDERQGIEHDYSRKGGVVHTELVTPEGAPDWACERSSLWNHVEATERRKDAQTAREIQVGLPAELSLDAQIEVVREFAQMQFAACGMVADVAIHHDNPNNPHAHIMLTMRPLCGDGFGAKCRDWNSKGLLLSWREEWAHACNHSLERAKVAERIDHRSFIDQGIGLTPTINIGVSAARQRQETRDVIRARIAEHDRIVRRNGESICQDPDIALGAVTHHKATFSRHDVGRLLHTHTVDAAQFERCMGAVMNAPSLVHLKDTARGRELFTTREMLAAEKQMLADGRAMALQREHAVAYHPWGGSLFSEAQHGAIGHLLDSGDLALLEGYAGSGKSTVLRETKHAWEGEGHAVWGAALSGKAAEGLEASSGIPARSLAAWEHAWHHGHAQMQRNHVLVIDEAAMVGTRQLSRVLDAAHRAGAKVVLVGDTEQLQAIEAGAPMRKLREAVGTAKLQEVRRQYDAWQRQACAQMAQGKTRQALDAFAASGRVYAHDKQGAAVAAIIRDWERGRRAAPQESRIILAYRRDEVRALNQAARAVRLKAGELGEGRRLQTASRGSLEVARGDRLCFLRSDRHLGVKNGTLGTVEGVRGHSLVVRLDDAERSRRVIDTRAYNHLDHGYAVTVHKSQGITVDHAHVLASPHFNRHATYVAMSRHRYGAQLHWSREAFGDAAKMQETLSRAQPKDMALDYAQVTRDNARLLATATQQGRGRAKDVTSERRRAERAQARGSASTPTRSLEAHKPTTPSQASRQDRARDKAIVARHAVAARRLRAAQRVAYQKPLSMEDVLYRNPVVQQRAVALQEARQLHDRLTYQTERHREAHPIKSALGLWPSMHDGRSNTLPLPELTARAGYHVTECKRALDGAVASPQVRAEAKIMVEGQQHAIGKAREALPGLEAQEKQLGALAQPIVRREIALELAQERALNRGLGLGR